MDMDLGAATVMGAGSRGPGLCAAPSQCVPKHFLGSTVSICLKRDSICGLLVVNTE